MQNEVGKGSFQELDQVAAVAPFVKYAGKARTAGDISAVVSSAAKVAVPACTLWRFKNKCTSLC